VLISSAWIEGEARDRKISSRTPTSRARSSSRRSRASRRQQKALDAFTKDFRAKWKPRIECLEGYETQDCDNAEGHADARFAAGGSLTFRHLNAQDGTIDRLRPHLPRGCVDTYTDSLGDGSQDPLGGGRGGITMLKPTRIWVWFVVVLLLAPAAGCGGDDSDDGTAEKALDGTFVGKLSGTNGFLAVVASPASRGRERRAVTVYLSDGEGLSAWFPGSAESNSFSASADGGEVTGKLSGDSASGTIELPDGKTVRYKATRATATSGLYELTFAQDGKLTGASAAGVSLTSRSRLEAPGTGTLKFADGKRRKVEITADGDRDPVRLRTAQARLIVLPDGEIAGAGQRGSSADAREPDFFIRSAS
jgi:hypothetical protein